MRRRASVGIALGAGGARGAAHIGVLETFEAHRIGIAAITGTSAGAAIGAMYAATRDTAWVKERYLTYLKSDAHRAIGTHHLRKDDGEQDSFLHQIGRFVKDRLVISLAVHRHGIIDRDKLARSIRFLLPVSRFEDLKIPLSVTSTDLNSGEEIVTSTGDLIEAVVESSSIPGFVKPLEEDDRLIVDGGVVAPIPIHALGQHHVGMTIAVDISRRGLKPLEDFSLLELISRVDQVTTVKLAEELSARADVVIRPDVGGAHWSEFSRAEEFIAAGWEAAQTAIPRIKKLLNERSRISYRVRKIFQSSR